MRKKHFYQIFSFLLVLCIIFMLQSDGIIKTSNHSVSQKNSVFSIFTGVFLHGNYRHLMGNISLLVLSLPLLFSLYPKSKYIVLSLGTIIPSIFCYLIGKDIIGISGLVFTVIWFLILSGLQNQDNLKFLVAVLLSAFLGNTLISITPSAGFNIAWESHLVGFLVGFVLSLFEKSK